MKKNKLTVPISMTATLAFILTCTLSCGKRNTAAENPTPPPEPATTNSAAGDATATNADMATPTNPAPAAAVASDATPEPATATPAPTPEPAPTLSATPAPTKVVEMPATIPVAPTNFYTEDFAKNSRCCAALAASQKNENYYFRFRAGYEHISGRDNNDSYYLSVKFYAQGDALRQRAGKNAWLIPDFDAEMAHHLVAKPDNDAHPGSDDGTSVRGNLFWPWLHWTPPLPARTNAVCTFCRPLALGLGPVASFGYDRQCGSTDYRFAHYAGVRLTLNRYGFIEYTAGGTEGLEGTRQQVVAELPIYTSRNGEVRYTLHGTWNAASQNSSRDILSGGLFLEMPFGTLTRPSKWCDLIPFKK